MNCRKCNNLIPEGTSICPFCGTSLGIIESEPIPAQGNSSNINIPVVGPIKQMPNDNASPLIEPIKPINNNSNTNYSNNGSKKSKMSIIISVVGLLALALIVFVVFRFIIPSVTSDTTEETSVYSVVGNDNYGYLKLPGEWYVFDNEEEHTSLQFINDNDVVVSLDVIDKSNNDELTIESLSIDSADEMENGEDIVDNITREEITVAGYDAYRTYGHYTNDDEWLVEYFFEIDDDNIYYIALEGTNLSEEYFDIPDTFSLTKIE